MIEQLHFQSSRNLSWLDEAQISHSWNWQTLKEFQVSKEAVQLWVCLGQSTWIRIWSLGFIPRMIASSSYLPSAVLSWKVQLLSQKNIFEPRKTHFLWSHPEFQTVSHYRATYSHLHRDNLSTAHSVGRLIILGNFSLLCHFMNLHKGIIVP